jgi:hypothetical protein
MRKVASIWAARAATNEQRSNIDNQSLFIPCREQKSNDMFPFKIHAI